MEKLSDFLIREINLLGEDKVNFIKSKHVAVFGLGGVGSFCAEALVRAGVGTITVCDGDRVAESNLNRQLFALRSTVGRLKTAVAKERFSDINPDLKIIEKPIFFNAETSAGFDFTEYDYVLDCIDNVTSKLLLVERCKSADKPVICCLGTGNKLDNTRFSITDIYKTKVCPLAKVMRKELRARGIDGLDVLYSEEEPRTPLCEDKRTPASISFVPSTAGLMIAGKVINDFLKEKEK